MVIRCSRTSLVRAALPLCCVASCARAQEADSGGFPSLDERRASAMPVAEVARSVDDSLFSQVTGIDVDSEGRIYVGDWQGARVAVLSPEGRLLRTMGRKGLGPGEFRSVRGLQVLPGDSLVVYDPSAARLTVFGPSGEVAYGLNLASVPGGAPFLVWRTPGNGGHVALTRPPFSDQERGPRRDHVRLLDLEGTARGEVLRDLPSRSFVRVQQGGGFSVMPNPFGFEGFVAVGPRVVFLADSDSLGAAAYDAEGRLRSRFTHEYQPPRVQDADVDSALGAMPSWAAGRFRLALADSAPERWPPLRGMLADDAGRVWLMLPSSAGQSREWAAFLENGRYAGSFFVPDGVEVLAVHGGRAYAVGDDGTAIIVYSLGERR